jgi:prevent-host-death family protein
MARNPLKDDPQIRTISANDAKQHLGATLRSVSTGEDEVIIESHGKPRAVIISPEEYANLRELRKKQRREAAIAEIEALAKQIGDRNRDLTYEQIEELSVRAVRETRQELRLEREAAQQDQDKL